MSAALETPEATAARAVIAATPSPCPKCDQLGCGTCCPQFSVERVAGVIGDDRRVIAAELREAIYESDNGDGSGRLHALLVSLGGVAREDGNS